MSRRSLTVVVVVVVGFAGWWTVGRQPAPDPSSGPTLTATPSPSPSTVVVPADTTTASSSPSAGPDAAGLTAAERKEVADFAVRFMKAFARPTAKVSARTWWQRVARMLSDDAVDDYAGITPDQVPFTKVTGTPQLEAVDATGDAFWIQPVTIATNSGTWQLLIELPSSGFSKNLRVLEVQEQ